MPNIEDHPHACGDKAEAKTSTFRLAGSSPRVWGQGTGTNKDTRTDRIIPTRMGTSIIDDGTNVFKRDHPHAYGDKLI